MSDEKCVRSPTSKPPLISISLYRLSYQPPHPTYSSSGWSMVLQRTMLISWRTPLIRKWWRDQVPDILFTTGEMHLESIPNSVNRLTYSTFSLLCQWRTTWRFLERMSNEFVLFAIVISEHTVKTYRSISLVYRKVAGICFNSLV